MENLVRVLNLVNALVPTVNGLVPLVQKAVRGEQFNDAEIAQIQKMCDALDAQIESTISSRV